MHFQLIIYYQKLKNIIISQFITKIVLIRTLWFWHLRLFLVNLVIFNHKNHVKTTNGHMCQYTSMFNNQKGPWWLQRSIVQDLDNMIFASSLICISNPQICIPDIIFAFSWHVYIWIIPQNCLCHLFQQTTWN